MCEACEERKAEFPKMMQLEQAADEEAVFDPEDFPKVLDEFAAILSHKNFRTTMEIVQDGKMPPQNAMRAYGSVMFCAGFIIASKTRSTWGEHFGDVPLPSPEEADTEFEKRAAERKEKMEGLVKATPEAIELLRSLGVQIPEGFDGQVMIGAPEDFIVDSHVQVSGQAENEEGETGNTGMYL